MKLLSSIRSVVRAARYRFGNKALSGVNLHGYWPTATQADIYYCYRLLLMREPDDAGWKSWTAHLRATRVPLAEVVDAFVQSEEFQGQAQQRHRTHLIDVGKFKLYVRLGDRYIGGAIACEGVYEPHVTHALEDVLTPGATFLDIGANIGYFTLLAAANVGPNGRVIAFEPNPGNCSMLERSIAANEFTCITLYPYAVAEKEQSFVLETWGQHSNGRVIDFAVDTDYAQSELPTVESVALDGFLELSRLDVVKMDIEGAEPRALQGMVGLIQRYRPIIFTEFSPELIRRTSQVEPETFLDQLSQLGYDLFSLSGRRRPNDTPQSHSEIMDAQRRSGLTHLDLIARPNENIPQR